MSAETSWPLFVLCPASALSHVIRTGNVDSPHGQLFVGSAFQLPDFGRLGSMRAKHYPGRRSLGKRVLEVQGHVDLELRNERATLKRGWGLTMKFSSSQLPQ